MRFYGLSDTHILAMPNIRFWFLYQTALRIEAQEDLRLLSITANTAGMEPNVEGIRALVKNLSDGVGKVVEFDGAEDPRNRPDSDFKERLRTLSMMG